MCHGATVRTKVDLLQVSLAEKTGEGKKSLSLFFLLPFFPRERLEASPRLWLGTKIQGMGFTFEGKNLGLESNFC